MQKVEVIGSLFRAIGVGNADATVRVLLTDKDGYALIVTGTTVPSGKKGYAIGCLFIKTDNGAQYRNTNTTASCTFTLISTLSVNAIAPVNMSTRTLVALSNGNATPTIAQLMTSSIFTMTPTTARNFTTPAAATMVAGIAGATVGTWFDFTVINLGNFAITMVAGDAGVTLVGDAVINKGAATYRAVLTNVSGGTEALSIYRMNDAVITPDVFLANTHILVGDVNGLAADVAMSGDATIAATGAVTLAVPKVFAVVSQSLVKSAFTDGGGTSGYIDITTQIPAGSIVLGWQAGTSVGFTGDTTAVVEVGVSGTVDKYSIVTSGSCLGAGTVGSTPKAANVYEAAAITARVTVTGGSDFTSIAAGATMVVTLYVIKTA